MNKTKTLIATALIASVGGWGAMTLASSHDRHGQMDHGAMHGADHGAQGDIPADASPSTSAYMEANEAMHSGMAIEFTGDADVDFAKGMIPHHEGAIAMAQIVLEHGEDPKIRALAEEIIAARKAKSHFCATGLLRAVTDTRSATQQQGFARTSPQVRVKCWSMPGCKHHPRRNRLY